MMPMQWTLVLLITLACAVHVAWRLFLPAAWRQRVVARFTRRAAVPRSASGACGGCSGCAPARSRARADEPVPVRITRRSGT